MAIDAFAEALTVIPKTLSLNAALDAIDLLSKLRSVHYKAMQEQYKEKEHLI